jgi:hypothetical protein
MRNHPRHPTTYNLILLITATPALVFGYAPFAWVTFVAYALPTLIALVAGALAVYRGYFASMITGA